MAKFIPVIIPQPGDDLKAWARQLTSQLQFLGQQLQSALSTLDQGGGGTSPGAVAPITTPGGVTVIDSNGYYIDGLGRVVVDATGLHVYDAVGFQIINGPNVYINTEQLVDNAVETAKLAAGAVTEVKIGNDAITAPKIQAGAIVAGKLAANAIVANDGVIGTAAIADAQIANLNANKINAGSIAAERMEANIVTALNGKFATLSALASSLGVVQILSGGALFTQGATAYATGTGVWMGQDGGVYKWRAGNPAGARIQWTGSALEVYNSSNQLTIASGNVDWEGITGAGKPENGATVGATFGDYNGVGKNISGIITPGNVTTYIANAAIGTAQIADAAIGNAQIGGDIYSSTWDWNNGWLLQRNGNLYCANAYVRGNVEASSLKAGVAMVDSLNLKGNAVIIPLQVSYGAKTVNLPYSNGTWQSQLAFQYMLSLGSGGLFKLSFTGTFYIDHWTGHANYGSGSLTKAIRLYINGGLVETLATNLPSGASAPLSLSQIPDKYYWLGAGNHVIQINMEAIMADGGARVACSAGSVTFQSFQTGSSSV